VQKEKSMVTIHDIEAAVTARESGGLLRVITSSVFVPVLNQEADLLVYLDPACETISQRQLDLLNGLLAVGPERLSEIKTQLYERWGEYDHFYTDEIQFEYDSPDAAFAASQIDSIVLNDVDDPHADWPTLLFGVDWDPEHGANVVYDRDQFRWEID
jgi:hypothetical protein